MEKVAELGCTSCHSGAAFNGAGTFQKFPVIADGFLEAKYHFTKDKGVAEVSKKTEDEHFFKVPTLRNIALTAPYFHNGSLNTLEEAIEFYNNTGKTDFADINNPSEIIKLNAQDIEELKAFLLSLTGKPLVVKKLPVIH